MSADNSFFDVDHNLALCRLFFDRRMRFASAAQTEATRVERTSTSPDLDLWRATDAPLKGCTGPSSLHLVFFRH
jgi:hypothetical protein